jgi:hypothetical protein
VNASLPGARAERMQRVAAELGAAFQQRAAYAPAHPQVRTALDRVVAALEDVRRTDGALEVALLLLEGQLLLDQQEVPEGAHWARGILRAFERHGIHGLTLVPGLDPAELSLFLEGCLGQRGPASTAHVRVGQAGYAAVGAPTPGTGDSAVPGLAELLGAAGSREAVTELRGVADGTVTRIDRLRGLVARLARAAEAGNLEALHPGAAGVDDAELLHGLAVALSTLRLGRALRLQGPALDDLALAGLLHDVGHLAAPAPDEDPARHRALHPVRGAARLAGLEGVPDVAIVVAQDHHLRFDRAAAYPATPAPRSPAVAAQVVAVADTWETIRARASIRVDEALSILQDRAGTFLDPALVGLLGAIVRPPAAPPPHSR